MSIPRKTLEQLLARIDEINRSAKDTAGATAAYVEKLVALEDAIADTCDELERKRELQERLGLLEFRAKRDLAASLDELEVKLDEQRREKDGLEEAIRQLPQKLEQAAHEARLGAYVRFYTGTRLQVLSALSEAGGALKAAALVRRAPVFQNVGWHLFDHEDVVELVRDGVMELLPDGCTFHLCQAIPQGYELEYQLTHSNSNFLKIKVYQEIRTICSGSAEVLRYYLGSERAGCPSPEDIVACVCGRLTLWENYHDRSRAEVREIVYEALRTGILTEKRATGAGRQYIFTGRPMELPRE